MENAISQTVHPRMREVATFRNNLAVVDNLAPLINATAPDRTQAPDVTRLLNANDAAAQRNAHAFQESLTALQKVGPHEFPTTRALMNGVQEVMASDDPVSLVINGTFARLNSMLPPVAGELRQTFEDTKEFVQRQAHVLTAPEGGATPMSTGEAGSFFRPTRAYIETQKRPTYSGVGWSDADRVPNVGAVNHGARRASAPSRAVQAQNQRIQEGSSETNRRTAESIANSYGALLRSTQNTGIKTLRVALPGTHVAMEPVIEQVPAVQKALDVLASSAAAKTARRRAEHDANPESYVAASDSEVSESESSDSEASVHFSDDE